MLSKRRRSSPDAEQAAQNKLVRNDWGPITVHGGTNYFGNQNNSDNGNSDRLDALLEKLFFPEERMRFEQIGNASADTYEWLFGQEVSRGQFQDDWNLQDSTVDKLLQGLAEAHESFFAFLSGATKRFWITGKPGSGKSSLMKFIATHDLLSSQLKHWRPYWPVITLTHFFWRPGVDLQRNVHGFLRNILGQVWQAFKDHDLNHVNIPTLRNINVWSVEWLWKSLRSLLQVQEMTFFFVIDGMDEIEEKSDTLHRFLSIFQDLESLPNVKVCASSRPDVVFWDTFTNTSRIEMQKLNILDMRKCAWARLLQRPLFQEYFEDDAQETRALITKVCSRADGVFLWLQLALDDLCRGLQSRDRLSNLNQRVDLLKTELFDLFRQLLARQAQVHREEVMAVCKFVCSHTAKTVWHLIATLPTYRPLLESTVNNEAIDTLKDRDICNLFNEVSNIERFIVERSAGLLDVKKRGGRCDSALTCSCAGLPREGRMVPVKTPYFPSLIHHFHNHDVVFLHRSVSNFFIEDERANDFLHAHTTGSLSHVKGTSAHELLMGVLVRSNHDRALVYLRTHSNDSRLWSTFKNELFLSGQLRKIYLFGIQEQLISTDVFPYKRSLANLFESLHHWLLSLKPLLFATLAAQNQLLHALKNQGIEHQELQRSVEREVAEVALMCQAASRNSSSLTLRLTTLTWDSFGWLGRPLAAHIIDLCLRGATLSYCLRHLDRQILSFGPWPENKVPFQERHFKVIQGLLYSINQLSNDDGRSILSKIFEFARQDLDLGSHMFRSKRLETCNVQLHVSFALMIDLIKPSDCSLINGFKASLATLDAPKTGHVTITKGPADRTRSKTFSLASRDEAQNETLCIQLRQFAADVLLYDLYESLDLEQFVSEIISNAEAESELSFLSGTRTGG